jgi:post-segregation antitoxin (ccd killing protein)
VCIPVVRHVCIVIPMGRHNVYLPEDLERLAEQLELSLSALLQAAIRQEAQRRGAMQLSRPSRYRKEEGITRSWEP